MKGGSAIGRSPAVSAARATVVASRQASATENPVPRPIPPSRCAGFTMARLVCTTRLAHSVVAPRPGRQLLPRRELLVAVGDLALLLVAHVEIKSPAERDALAGGDLHIAGMRLVLEILEIVLSEGIGGKKRIR